MVFRYFLIIIHFNSIYLISFNHIEPCMYSKTYYYNGIIYFVGNTGVCKIGLSSLYKSSGYLNHKNETGQPFIEDYFVYTTRINNNNKIEFIKKGISTIESVNNRSSGSQFKLFGNICLFRITISTTNYYYCAWIDSDLFINIMKYDYVNSLIISSTKSSNILNKGPTIDCKGFSYYEHIICVYLGYDGCNVNIYSSELSDYSDTLIQKNNLVDLGFNCDSRSIGQKIFNIDDNKFFICYSQTDNNIYCILGKHQLPNFLIITSETSQKVLEGCITYYSEFDIGRINQNYLLICMDNVNEGYFKYIIFNKDLELIGKVKLDGFSQDTYSYKLTLPSVLYISDLSLNFVTFDYFSSESSHHTIYFNLTSPTCTTGFTLNSGNINTDNIINLSSYVTGTNSKIKFFNLPSKGIFKKSGDIASISEIYDKTSTFTFNVPNGGVYKFTYYAIDSDLYSLSNVCEGTINIMSCNESCHTCSGEEIPLSHRCSQCLNGYYPLSERASDTVKNCYNSTTILELDNGYYYDTDDNVWKECYETCKKCSTLGTSTEHKCTSCQNNLIFDIYIKNNCITSCDKFWHRDINKINHICIDKCNSNYPYLINETNECVSSCTNANNNGKIYYYYSGECISKCPSNTLPDDLTSECHELNNFDEFYKGITNYIISANPLSNIYVYNNEIKFYFYNSTEKGMEEYKELSNLYNITMLNLDDCFNKIRNSNKIYENYIFYIALFEFNRNDVMTPQYNFMIYNQYGVKYKNEICDNILITKSFKNTSLMDYVFEKYNKDSIDILYYSKSNKFYNDICTTVSNNSYDILLDDRYEIYHNNSNYYFCEENCNITNIDLKNYKVDCICSNLSSFSEYEKVAYKKYKEDKIIKDKNFQFMKCSPFTSKLKKNVGNYIIIFSFAFQVFSLIYFCLYGLNKIIVILQSPISVPPNKNSKTKIRNIKDIKRNYYLNSNKSSNLNFGKEERTNNPSENEDIMKEIKSNVYKVGISIDNFYNNLKKKYKNNNSENIDFEKERERESTDSALSEKVSIISGLKFSNLYFMNIKNKHKLISLFQNDKYDISVYKISLFILTFSLDIFFCCLFDSVSHIQKLYHKNKKFIGKDEILIAIYSLLSSYFITKIIDFFMEYKNELYEYNKKTNRKKENLINNIKSKIECKFIIYFVLSFIITGFIWYFVNAFLQTYNNNNTLINLLLCYIFNFLFSFIIPFIYYGFVTYLEYKGISSENKSLHKFALFLLKL